MRIGLMQKVRGLRTSVTLYLCRFDIEVAYNMIIRCLDHPLCLDHSVKDILRYHTGRIPGDLMDAHQHILHVRLVSHVPLGERGAF